MEQLEYNGRYEKGESESEKKLNEVQRIFDEQFHYLLEASSPRAEKSRKKTHSKPFTRDAFFQLSTIQIESIFGVFVLATNFNGYLK